MPAQSATESAPPADISRALMTNGLFFERRFPGATTCIVLGPLSPAHPPADLARARAVLWCADSADLRTPLRLPRDCALVTVPLADARANWRPALEQLVQRDARHLPSVFVSERIAGPHADDFLALLAELQATLDRHHRARQTRQKDGFTWQHHLLRNLPAYTAQRVPAEWAGALAGLPAFVCGAGPSLDVTAPLVAAHGAHAVIFAADSALPGLARHDVAADFAVSVDAAKVPEKCLPADPALHPAHVVLTSVSPPAWTSALPSARLHFLSCRQVTLDWLATRGVARTALTAAPNCGHTALELARFLGCSPVYLFGLDLAVSAQQPAQRHHAAVDATLYTHSGFDASAPLPTVPGNYEERVPTFAPDDWRALDECIARAPAGTVINVNDRGARFHAATLVAPADLSFSSPSLAKSAALARLASAPPADPAALAAVADHGARAVAQLDALRRAFADGGAAGAVTAFRQLLADQNIARIFGAFSLKLMPHLLPPVTVDHAFWSAAITEFATLAALAAYVAAPGAKI